MSAQPKRDVPNIVLPNVPTSFAELNELSLEQLNRLLTDEVAFSVFLMSLSQVKVRRVGLGLIDLKVRVRVRVTVGGG